MSNSVGLAINDTHRERLAFHSIQYRNSWLAAPDFFHMFAQLIKFYTFLHQYRCLKNVIPQTDSKNRFLLLSASLRQNWVSFCLNTGKRLFLEVSFSSQQKEHRFF